MDVHNNGAAHNIRADQCFATAWGSSFVTLLVTY